MKRAARRPRAVRERQSTHQFIRSALPTRDRILSVSRRLFQERGYFAVGTAEILEAAGAPKGSMYHHFPGGKEQIAIEADDEIRKDVLTHMLELESKGLTVAESLRSLAKSMASWLKSSEWREGTMLASTTVGSVPDLPALHESIKIAFDMWHEHIANRLMGEGRSPSDAVNLAQTALSGIEGAMIVARVAQDERIVIKVAETLAGLCEKGERSRI